MSNPKRRKLGHDNDLLAIQDALPDILSQINVEISVRDRLSQTLKARIDWANALKAVLEDQGKGISNTPENVRTLASDVLANAEFPSQVLFATPDFTLGGQPSQASRSPQPQSRPKEPYHRPPPRQKPLPSRGKPSFLYISGLGATDTNETPYLLRCPICSRTAFSSLQGLLNHARISHSIEWGTHDACIKACAVPEPGLDIDSGVEVGVGPSGIRPGLQTIFERAVGVPSAVPVAIESSTSRESVSDGAIHEFRRHSQLSIPNLTQTLGVHEETPALAPFLGKEAQRREIKVYDEDVNIIALDSAHGFPMASRPAWTMTFAPRHRHEPFSEVTMNVSPPPGPNVSASEKDMKIVDPAIMSVPKAPTVLVPSSKSRFHFSARVAISDRSLFLGLESTPGGYFSCKWMIAVDNPSYATPVSSVLKYVKVTPICDDANAVYLPVAECYEPPFIVLGFSNTPFLARVELVFNDIMKQTHDGSSYREPQTAVVEHWVDLDPLKRSSVVLGEEQLVDVELDRLTDVKPLASTKVSFESRQLWNDPVRLPFESDVPSKPDEQEEFSEEYRLLLETAKRFPLVQQAKERSQSETNVPYRLVSSRAQFNDLIAGRKQAIKWGRARAIREAYFDGLRSAGSSLPDITTTDIFLWLEENGSSTQTHRGQVSSEEKKKSLKTKDDPQDSGKWCPQCGFEEKYHQHSWEGVHLHGRVDLPQEGRTPLEGGISSPSCILLQSLILPQLQRTSSVPRPPRSLAPNTVGSSFAQLQPRKPNRTLLQSVDPSLVSLVERVVSSSRLPAFRNLCISLSDRRDRRPHYPIDTRGANKDQVESSLTPFALLAHSVQQFLVELVSKGAQQATLERSLVLRTLKRSGGARRSAGDPRSGEVVTVLTPGHIQRGNSVDGL